MKFILDRKDHGPDGVFGVLYDGKHNQLFVTLEHAYLEDGKYTSKIPDGSYECNRGEHRLHNMTEDFTTFEITSIEGHTNILFHVGNYNEDSEGCVLLGKGMGHKQGVNWKTSGGKMIVNSRVAFNEFMKMLDGVDSFQLEVVSG